MKSITSPIPNTLRHSLKRPLLATCGALGLLFSASWSGAQPASPAVVPLEVPSNQVTTVQGNLNSGQIIEDLSWAQRSSVACFPGTRFNSYRGHHVFYRTQLPPRSIMKIKVQPVSGVDVNLYAYMGGSGQQLPPNVSSVTSCESSENYGRPNPGGAQEVRLNATTNSYPVIIAVAGPEGVRSGSYTLTIDLETATPEPEAPVNMTSQTIPTESGQTVSANGNLSNGYILPLDWANTSQLACFPSHHNPFFRGKHVFFRAALPPNSTMKITVTPNRPDLDINIYGIRLSANDSTTMPPNVGSGVCDASYSSRGPEPGVAEDLQFLAIRGGYTILIGVAGPAGVTEGDFTVSVEVQPR